MNAAQAIRQFTGLAMLAASCCAAAQPVRYFGALSGAAESPPVASPAIGFTQVAIDTTAHALDVAVVFSGLTSAATAAHIHCCTTDPITSTAGVATQTPYFVSFPVGATAGTYLHSFDLTSASSFNASFVTAHGGTPAGAEAALAAGMAAGKAYLNIHTTNFPGGEIRTFLFPDAVFASSFE